MKRGNSSSILRWTRADEKREPLQQALDVRIGALEGLEPQAAGDLRELARELAAQLADVVQLLAVVLEKARIHQPPCPTSSTVAAAALEIDLRAQEQPQRQRLRPQLGLDLEAHRVVAHLLGVGDHPHLDRALEQPRLEVGDDAG